MFRPNRIGPSCLIDVGVIDYGIVDNHMTSGVVNTSIDEVGCGVLTAAPSIEHDARCFFINNINMPANDPANGLATSIAFGIPLTGFEDQGVPDNIYHMTVSGAFYMSFMDNFGVSTEFINVFPIIGRFASATIVNLVPATTDGSDFNLIDQWSIIPSRHNSQLYGSTVSMTSSFKEDILIGEFSASSNPLNFPLFIGWCISKYNGGDVRISGGFDIGAFKYLKDLETFDPTR